MPTWLNSPVQSIQYNGSAIDFNFTKFTTNVQALFCQKFVNPIMCLLLRSQIQAVFCWTVLCSEVFQTFCLSYLQTWEGKNGRNTLPQPSHSTTTKLNVKPHNLIHTSECQQQLNIIGIIKAERMVEKLSTVPNKGATESVLSCNK